MIDTSQPEKTSIPSTSQPGQIELRLSKMSDYQPWEIKTLIRLFCQETIDRYQTTDTENLPEINKKILENAKLTHLLLLEDKIKLEPGHQAQETIDSFIKHMVPDNVPPGDLNRALINTIWEKVVLEYNGLKDPLTQINNRQALEQHLQRIIAEHARGTKRTFALCYLDLNKFKPLNDSKGHHQGDEALKKVGELLINNSRGGVDTAARLGGDEFGLLLDHVDPANIRTVVTEKLYQVLNDVGKIENNFGLSFAAGVLIITPEIIDFIKNSPDPILQLIKVAERAMQQGKNANKPVVMVKPGIDHINLALESQDIIVARR